MDTEIQGSWDIVVTSLQDICNSNESLTFDSIYAKYATGREEGVKGQDKGEKEKEAKAEDGEEAEEEEEEEKEEEGEEEVEEEKEEKEEEKKKKRVKEVADEDDSSRISLAKLSSNEMTKLQEDIVDHKSNVATAKRLINTSCENLTRLIEILQREEEENAKKKKKSSTKTLKTVDSVKTPGSFIDKKRDSKFISAGSSQGKGKKLKRIGRSFWQSKYNPSEPIFVGSEVAFKLRNRNNEWIQCEVVKILGDGIKFEIRDPEPDENNNPGQTFKANYKEILLIPPEDRKDEELMNYAYGTKVLARYPDTTTYYAAVVVGNRKDGFVRLKFDGEEEVNKETEVKRRLVLPFPQK
ncbi:hypothetical protein KGF56_002052 [Candida oxycetoniae]|uniref:SGF29 C-terminal domain-containing protein n=1 Tax=Candida oxycetoniae TaxID=497107 RepID=A0AAI9SYY7_9ASCO|nr:uncharacterized protein KGF56_002052 [Candida oxycetoniae]KAI3405096.2 hypothetical protein KGF56_002052 [Candida oxycetoniae]